MVGKPSPTGGKIGTSALPPTERAGWRGYGCPSGRLIQCQNQCRNPPEKGSSHLLDSGSPPARKETQSHARNQPDRAWFDRPAHTAPHVAESRAVRIGPKL